MAIKKITLVISSMRSGGAERVMANLANYWAGEGHKVSLILFTPPHETPFYNLDERIDLIQLDCLSNHASYAVRLKKMLYCLYILRKTFQLIRSDCIVSFLESVNMAVLISGLGLKIPTIISERTNPKIHRVAPLYAVGRKYLYKLCDRLVVQTKSVFDHFTTFQSFISIIPNGVGRPKKQCETCGMIIHNVVSIGRLSHEKNHITLIKAFAEFVKKHPGTKLTIYGDGEERSKLESLIHQLGISQNVSLPGITNDVNAALMNADLFVFPSLYEGFPNALCEAMSVGLPVIASNVSGNNDIVIDGENGLLFTATDSDALCQKMMTLVDYDLRQKLSSNAKKIVDDYDQIKIHQKWDQVIEDVCAA